MSVQRSSFARDLLFYAPAKALPAASIFFVTLFLIRALPGREYVPYSQAVSIAQIGVQFAAGWIAAAIVFHLPGEDDVAAALPTYTLVSIVFSAIAGLVAAVASMIATRDAALAVCSGALAFALGVATLEASARQALQNAPVQLAMSLVFAAVFPLLVLLASRGSLRSHHAIAAFAASYAVSCAWPVAQRLRRARGFAGFRTVFTALFRYGSPLSVWAASILLLTSGDKFVLPATDDASAYISMKDLLIGAVSLLGMPILMTAHPRIFSAHRAGEDWQAIIRSSLDLLAIAFGALWAALGAFAIAFVERRTGRNYASVELPIHMAYCALFLGAVGLYVQKPLEIARRTRGLATIAATFALGAMLGYALVASRFGPLGVAFVLLATQLAHVSFVAWRAGTPWGMLPRTVGWFVITAGIGWSGAWTLGAQGTLVESPVRLCVWLLVFGSVVAYVLHVRARRI